MIPAGPPPVLVLVVVLVRTGRIVLVDRVWAVRVVVSGARSVGTGAARVLRIGVVCRIAAVGFVTCAAALGNGPIAAAAGIAACGTANEIVDAHGVVTVALRVVGRGLAVASVDGTEMSDSMTGDANALGGAITAGGVSTRRKGPRHHDAAQKVEVIGRKVMGAGDAVAKRQ